MWKRPWPPISSWAIFKPMTITPSRGEVWLFDLGMAEKVRPALVVSVGYWRRGPRLDHHPPAYHQLSRFPIRDYGQCPVLEAGRVPGPERGDISEGQGDSKVRDAQPRSVPFGLRRLSSLARRCPRIKCAGSPRAEPPEHFPRSEQLAFLGRAIVPIGHEVVGYASFGDEFDEHPTHSIPAPRQPLQSARLPSPAPYPRARSAHPPPSNASARWPRARPAASSPRSRCKNPAHRSGVRTRAAPAGRRAASTRARSAAISRSPAASPACPASPSARLCRSVPRRA